MEANPPAKLRVLFVCTGNSCRSQIAEGLCRHLRGDVIEPASAGIEAFGMNPLTNQVMREIGIDTSAQWSKTLNDIDARAFDYVVTLCSHADKICPAFPPGVRVVHHGFPDPAAASSPADHGADAVLMPYRRIRDAIRGFVAGLPGVLHDSKSEETNEPR